MNNNKTKLTIIAVLTGILTFSIFAMTSLSINQVSSQFADCQTTLSLASLPRTGTVTSDRYPSYKFIG